jgi:hypothetical protein
VALIILVFSIVLVAIGWEPRISSKSLNWRLF